MSTVFKAVTVVSVISLLLVSGFVSIKPVQHATSTPAGMSAPGLAIRSPPHRDAADTAGPSTAVAHANADSALAYGAYDRHAC